MGTRRNGYHQFRKNVKIAWKHCKDIGLPKLIEKLCEESMKEFESAMNANVNTALALAAFMKFVTEINRYAAADELTKPISKSALVIFSNFMDILGLKVNEATEME